MNATSHRIMIWAVTALAMVGAAIGGYLTITHFADQPVICGGLGSCATVQSSEYAAIGGVPIALLGLFMYLAIGGLALVSGRRPVAMFVAFGIALSGALYSAYLTWVELAVLHAICLWCVASAGIVSTIAILTGLAVLSPSSTQAQARQQAL
jgi:uncharacterized membrane protein